MDFYGACPSILCTHDTPGVTNTLVKFEQKIYDKIFHQGLSFKGRDNT